MKKNAILVASILFVAAGCAHQGSSGRAGYDSGSELEVQSSSMNTTTEHLNRYPDQTPRTPSAALQHDPATFSHSDMPSDPSLDTEIRARGVDSYSSSDTSTTGSTSGSVSADRNYSVDTNIDTDRGDFGQSSSAQWESDKGNGSVQGSANWNASDDLLRDGISDNPEMNNDASIGGAATSESGSGSSSDFDSGSSPEDLNASPKLEKNISGEYEIPENSQTSASENSDSFDSSRVPEPLVHVTGNEPEPLFHNNRAQGVGSAATGEQGVVHSRNPLGSERDGLSPQPEPNLGHDLEDSTDELQPE